MVKVVLTIHMKIAIYGSRRQEAQADNLRKLIRSLVLDGVEVWIHAKFYDCLTDLGIGTTGLINCRDVFPRDTDLVLSIGGDGTFLRTAAWVGDSGTPILGVNTGHLGYLAAMSLDQLLTSLDRVLTTPPVVEARTLIQVVSPAIRTLPFALNEVAITKDDGTSMIEADTLVNGRRLANYKADGLVVSTPTGSTAYNLSVGGPIVQPTAPVWVISPIAAHSLSMRPTVVGDDACLDITVTGRAHNFRLSLDGRTASLPIGSRVRLERAPYCINIVQTPGSEFPEVLHQKLMFS